jgi:hypothetical protein
VRRRLGGGEQMVKCARESGVVGPGGEMTLRPWKIPSPTTTHRGMQTVESCAYVRQIQELSL